MAPCRLLLADVSLEAFWVFDVAGEVVVACGSEPLWGIWATFGSLSHVSRSFVACACDVKRSVTYHFEFAGIVLVFVTLSCVSHGCCDIHSAFATLCCLQGERDQAFVRSPISNDP